MLAALSSARREAMARQHLPLVNRRAYRLAGETGLPVDEAKSAGLLGLAEAIDGYLPELGPFEPFAQRVIDRRIRDAGRGWRWHGRADFDPCRQIVSDEQIVALIPDTLTTAELIEQRTDIARALAVLDGAERRVVMLHGRLGHSLVTVAAMLDLDPDHARYVWRRALSKMRIELQPAEVVA